ncbi:hypothetical protein CSHOW_2012 [Campylobacter showae]|uniref:hypothetical protein n=1 Tax=Campylobacter showae TaxID=204 RepID=UPI0002D85CBF|nr:hypothetical protein [Campylobacter showae]QCD49899.1 hypothetical protein CSHOW_2012 [Campylobacter showae]
MRPRWASGLSGLLGNKSLPPCGKFNGIVKFMAEICPPFCSETKPNLTQDRSNLASNLKLRKAVNLTANPKY